MADHETVLPLSYSMLGLWQSLKDRMVGAGIARVHGIAAPVAVAAIVVAVVADGF